MDPSISLIRCVEELEEARAKVVRCLSTQQKLDEQLAADGARLGHTIEIVTNDVSLLQTN